MAARAEMPFARLGANQVENFVLVEAWELGNMLSNQAVVKEAGIIDYRIGRAIKPGLSCTFFAQSGTNVRTLFRPPINGAEQHLI